MVERCLRGVTNSYQCKTRYVQGINIRYGYLRYCSVHQHIHYDDTCNASIDDIKTYNSRRVDAPTNTHYGGP